MPARGRFGMIVHWRGTDRAVGSAPGSCGNAPGSYPSAVARCVGSYIAMHAMSALPSHAARTWTPKVASTLARTCGTLWIYLTGTTGAVSIVYMLGVREPRWRRTGPLVPIRVVMGPLLPLLVVRLAVAVVLASAVVEAHIILVVVGIGEVLHEVTPFLTRPFRLRPCMWFRHQPRGSPMLVAGPE